MVVPGGFERVSGMMGADQVSAVQLPVRISSSERGVLRSSVDSLVVWTKIQMVEHKMHHPGICRVRTELPTPILSKLNTMGGFQLICKRHIYLEGPNAVNLNTVDVWIPESAPIVKGDGKTWVMFVKSPLLSDKH
jgi:hypothetical protein